MSSERILVVDDQPINVQLLKRKLERCGLAVSTANNGLEALEQVKLHKPDLILLDLMMPDMDGIEVCQRLQERSDTRSIPVIFVTARTTKESKLEGLAVGAVDYITKPIDLDETVARVQTQLRFAAINRENLELQRRLEESRRAATIGAVAQGIAHNLNNLLGVVIGYLDLIKAGYDKPPVVKKNAQNVDDAIQRIVGIIRQLSTLVVKSRPDLARVPLERLIDGGIRRFHNDYKLTAGVVVTNATPDLEIDTNIETFEEVLSKVLMNAWESYQDSPAEQRPISIYTRVFDKARGEKMLEIRVDDSGRGIAEEIRDRMFEPFVSTKRTVGVGMGLTIARHSLRSVGGEVTMSSRPEGGSSAVLVHPVRDPRRRDKSQDDEE
ncbi:MAG: hybrid sensor histidine kinase/response regulator [Opitutaceae bacterium]|jgi:CheY-like chemotaxis protein